MNNNGLNLFIAPTAGGTEITTMLQRQAESQMMAAAAEVAMQEKKTELTLALEKATEEKKEKDEVLLTLVRQLTATMKEKLQDMLSAGNYLLAAAKTAAIRSLQDTPYMEVFCKDRLPKHGVYTDFIGFYTTSSKEFAWVDVWQNAHTHGKIVVSVEDGSGRRTAYDVVDISTYPDIIELIGKVVAADNDHASARAHASRIEESLGKLNNSAADVKAAMARHGLSQTDEGRALLDMARAAIG
jgi:hypothetical protein